MAKKITGIVLLVLGGAFFLFSCYGFIAYITTTKEWLIARGVDPGYAGEPLEQHLKKGRIVTAIDVVIGAGIALGGYVLVGKKKADKQSAL